MKKNMGIIDRSIRILLAAAVALFYFTGQLTGIAAVVLLARMVRRGAHGGASGSLVLGVVIAVVMAQPASLMLMP